MTDINSVTIVGRLTKDIGTDPNGRDFQYTQGGICIARISIAVNRARKQADGSWGDEAHFFDVTVFGKTAENLRQYLTKGRQIAVSGHLQQERWQDQNGNNRSRVSIVADNVQLVGGGQQNGGGQGYAQNTYQAAGGQTQQNYGGYQQGGGQPQQQGYQQQYQPMNGGQGYQPP